MSDSNEIESQTSTNESSESVNSTSTSVKVKKTPSPRRSRSYGDKLLIVGIVSLTLVLLVVLTVLIVYLYKSITYIDNGSNTTPPRATVTGRIPSQHVCGLPARQPSVEGVLLNVPNEGRIINGENALLNSWPWVVSLRMRSGAQINEHICGGSLIYSNYVLTAAHCVFKRTARKLAVIVGSNSLDSVEHVYYVSELVYHSEFDKNEIINDIALLKLEKHVTFSDSVSTICLPESFDHTIIFDKNVVVVGWGSISGTDAQNSLSTHLKQSVLKILNTKSVCIKSNTNNNYCALDEKNSSNACYGDSGGPMMFYTNNKWYLYGVTSFVFTQSAKCYPTLPSFYTIIPNYLEWIGNWIATLSNQ